jgi:hypothetical protein
VRKYIVRAACAIALLAGSQANAMTYSYRLWHGKAVIDAVGEIQPNEATIFSNWLATTPFVRDHLSAALVLNSPGGNVDAAWWLGLQVYKARINTGVSAGGICASACVFVWASGEHKSVAPDSRIGVHQPSIYERMAPGGLVRALGDGLAMLGAPYSVVEAANTVPPNSIHWLTPQELSAWNVKVTY